jgi:hypothetical protein
MAVSDEMTSDRGVWREKTSRPQMNWENSRKKKKNILFAFKRNVIKLKLVLSYISVLALDSRPRDKSSTVFIKFVILNTRI